MTIWAGLYSREPGVPIDVALQGSMRALLSRTAGDHVHSLGDDRARFFVVELDPRRSPTWLSHPDGSLTVVAGEPMLPDINGQDRLAQIRALDAAWGREDFSTMAATQGTFCGGHYNSRSGGVALVVDRLGVRPLYFAMTTRVVLFSTAMRVLEGLAELDKALDLQGVIEIAAIGYPLADRTAYENIRMLRAAESVVFLDNSITRRRYWRLDQVALRPRQEAEAAREVRDCFTSAIGQRLGSDRNAIAFLSGGLDSRSIVAELRARDVRVFTFGFGEPWSKDQVLGRAFARAAGTIHATSALPPGSIRWSSLLAEVLANSEVRSSGAVERPNTVWSGDGGSVGLGHVYISEAVIAHLRAKRRDQAVSQFLDERAIRLPGRLFRRRVALALSDALFQGVREEFDDIRCEDPGRDIYVFCMLNDQRRHLTTHYEDIDLHRLEMQLPFFDAALIQTVASLPIDICILHRLYNKVLRLLPPPVLSVPWQAYRGHEPCPIPISKDLIDQWSSVQARRSRNAYRAIVVREAKRVLSSDAFPTPLLDRRFLRLAAVLHRAGVRDYGYAIDFAATFEQHWRASAGRWPALPDSAKLIP